MQATFCVRNCYGFITVKKEVFGEDKPDFYKAHCFSTDFEVGHIGFWIPPPPPFCHLFGFKRFSGNVIKCVFANTVVVFAVQFFTRSTCINSRECAEKKLNDICPNPIPIRAEVEAAWWRPIKCNNISTIEPTHWVQEDRNHAWPTQHIGPLHMCGSLRL